MHSFGLLIKGTSDAETEQLVPIRPRTPVKNASDNLKGRPLRSPSDSRRKVFTVLLER